jgi:hypothetical protein
MTFNLDAECTAIEEWTPLQADVCMCIANAKFIAFENEAFRCGDLLRLGLLKRSEAADVLHEAAIYNQLYFEYGIDAIQAIMSAALDSEVAA